MINENFKIYNLSRTLCSIDNHPREIRFYEESATCVMADNAVAQLSFQRGEEPGTRQAS